MIFPAPARTAQQAVQWLYFAYLAAVKSQNGGAMSLGRTATFLDIYIERDLKAGLISERDAQELVDHFIMKIRMVRFLRTPQVQLPLLRRPHLGHRGDRWHGA
ncbi:pyruvate formate lyase family protein [Escherichia coli]